jgi:hypothetical protein
MFQKTQEMQSHLWKYTTFFRGRIPPDPPTIIYGHHTKSFVTNNNLSSLHTQYSIVPFCRWPTSHNLLNIAQISPLFPPSYTHNNLISCSKFDNKPSISCVRRTACPKLSTTLEQVWNNLLTTCNKLDGIIRFVTRLFQQVRYSPDITILLQPSLLHRLLFGKNWQKYYK